MSVSLKKGQNISLTKAVQGLSKVSIGLGWDVRATAGDAFDLDASIFLVGTNGKVRSDNDFIFYNNLKSSCGSVEHTGDNRTGVGEGDDEVIKVDLTKIPSDVEKVVFTVSIFEAEERRQTFGMVLSAFVRVVNIDDNKEITRFDLSEDASIETSMIFGELYKHSGEWKFRAVGQGFAGGLGELASFYGVNIG